MIVLDASAAVELLGRSAAGLILARRIATEQTLHAPYLLDIEVTNALRRHCAQGLIAADRAKLALLDFQRLRVLRHRHKPYLDRIWQFRENFTAYDACYLALTEALDATLLTRDSTLASARLRRGNVEVV